MLHPDILKESHNAVDDKMSPEHGFDDVVIFDQEANAFRSFVRQLKLTEHNMKETGVHKNQKDGGGCRMDSGHDSQSHVYQNLHNIPPLGSDDR